MFKDQYLFLNFTGENPGPTIRLRVFQTPWKIHHGKERLPSANSENTTL